MISTLDIIFLGVAIISLLVLVLALTALFCYLIPRYRRSKDLKSKQQMHRKNPLFDLIKAVEVNSTSQTTESSESATASFSTSSKKTFQIISKLDGNAKTLNNVGPSSLGKTTNISQHDPKMFR